MATYITLVRYTEKGIRSIKEGPARLDAAKQAFRAAGRRIETVLLGDWPV
jgi:uncharacterized protein with GYD domain